jgi:glucan phosphoethanolaminetransferase (alkaline phosphatase superfamily)
MLLSVFTSMYEVFIGANPDYPEYREGIFNAVGLMTLVVAIGMCLLFFVLLGRWKNIWYTRTHWTITLLLTAVIGFAFAYSQGKSQLSVADSYLIRFAAFNALYGAVYFAAFSLLFKNFSIYSKRIPF